MGNSRRLRGHKQMGMNRRSKGNRKPMSEETKADRKVTSATDRARTKVAQDKRSEKKVSK
jgi:hypothetical protein